MNNATIPQDVQFDDQLTARARWQQGMQRGGCTPYADDKTQLPVAQRVTEWCLAWRVCDGLLVLVHLLHAGKMAVYPSGVAHRACYVTTTASEPLYWGPYCDDQGRIVAA